LARQAVREVALAKASDRGLEAEFAAADAFELERLGRRFQTVLDCGLFHTFDGSERRGYVASLAAVTERAGGKEKGLAGARKPGIPLWIVLAAFAVLALILYLLSVLLSLPSEAQPWCGRGRDALDLASCFGGRAEAARCRSRTRRWNRRPGPG